MTGAAQLPLALRPRPAQGRADFHVSASNLRAVTQVEAWRDWPGRRCALAGPAGSGKSHLASVWAAEAGAAILPAADLAAADPAALRACAAVAVEDADRGLSPEAERALFHLHERLGASGGALLVTGREAPGRWPIRLPDLATRLAALPLARLDPPDDDLLEALTLKLFADRGVLVAPGLPRYLARRAPRSHRALAEAVAALDREGLARGARLTRQLAGPVLDRLFPPEPAENSASPRAADIESSRTED